MRLRFLAFLLCAVFGTSYTWQNHGKGRPDKDRHGRRKKDIVYVLPTERWTKPGNRPVRHILTQVNNNISDATDVTGALAVGNKVGGSIKLERIGRLGVVAKGLSKGARAAAQHRYGTGGHPALAGHHQLPKTDDEEEEPYLDRIAMNDWCILALGLIMIGFVEVVIFQKLPMTIGYDLLRIVIALSCAATYGLIVYEDRGERGAVEWWSGYALEWLLSSDTQFAFTLIFKTYKTPVLSRHKALAYWIPLGISTRMAMYIMLAGVFSVFTWVKIFAGLYVIYNGVIAVVGDDDAIVSELAAVRLFHWIFGDRIVDEYDKENQSIFYYKAGQLKGTLLSVVLVTLVVVDVTLSIDTVSARVSRLPCKYLAFSSTMMALFGLRSFVCFLENLVEIFAMLKYGIAAIIVLIGTQLMLSGISPDLVQISIADSFKIIFALLASSIAVSIIHLRVQQRASQDLLQTIKFGNQKHDASESVQSIESIESVGST